MCGDCITNDCELGRDKKSCEDYQAHIRQQRFSGERMQEMASNSEGKKRAIAILLGDLAWDKVAESLSDLELADELMNKVWAIQKAGTFEIAIVCQAIERLRGNKPK